MRWLLLIILFASSCSLFAPKFSRSTFNYTGDAKPQAFNIIVPRGYITAKHAADSAGTGIIYNYGKATFYIAYLNDTTLQTEFVDPSVNMPLAHPKGGLIYKGWNQNGFWREIRRGRFRVGYKDVPNDLEGSFDSATNFAANLPVK